MLSIRVHSRLQTDDSSEKYSLITILIKDSDFNLRGGIELK